MTTEIHICRVPQFAYRRMAVCPVCETKRRIVTVLEGWYGSTQYCCGCGTTFQDGYYSKVPEGEKAEAIAEAKALWKSVTMTKAEARRADREYVFGTDED